jgi:hypothetical protein
LLLKDGILFREVKNDGDETTKQLVLPTTYVKTVLQSLHDEMGHPGRDRTLIFFVTIACAYLVK